MEDATTAINNQAAVVRGKIDTNANKLEAAIETEQTLKTKLKTAKTKAENAKAKASTLNDEYLAAKAARLELEEENLKYEREYSSLEAQFKVLTTAATK